MPSVQRKTKSGHAETNRWTTILQSWITTYMDRIDIDHPCLSGTQQYPAPCHPGRQVAHYRNRAHTRSVHRISPNQVIHCWKTLHSNWLHPPRYPALQHTATPMLPLPSYSHCLVPRHIHVHIHTDTRWHHTLPLSPAPRPAQYSCCAAVLLYWFCC